MNDLSLYRGSDEVVHVSVIKDLIDNLPTQPKVYSGIPILDQTLKYFELGEIVVLSGPPGHGKTSFARYLISQFGKGDYRPLYFGMEGGVVNFFQKFPELPNFYMSKEYIKSSFEWMKQRILEGKQKYGCKIVVIDHLHYILDMAQVAEKNSSIYIGQFMRDLVRFAKDENVLVFLIAHTNKETFARYPNLGDIRDSSFIAQEADMVLFVWRAQEINHTTGEIKFVENEGRLSIQKSRRNGVLRTFKTFLNNGTFEISDMP